MNGISVDAIEPQRVNPNSSNPQAFSNHDSVFINDNHIDPETPQQRDPYSLDLGSSYRFNLLALGISLSKVSATILLFVASTLNCFSAKEIWLLIILFHDIAYSMVIATRLKLINTIQALTMPEPQLQDLENQVYDLQEIHPNNPDRANLRNSLQAPLVITSQRNLDNRLKAQAKLNIISRSIILSDITYLGLLIYGQILYFIKDKDLNVCESPPVNYLMLAYLVMGYIWLLLPVILMALACLCLPCLICAYMSFTRTQVPANYAAIKKLKTQSYKKDLPGAGECTICMVDYEEGDKIIQLKCSPMHYFHEACIKKWLKINGQCPTCRERLS